MNLTRRGAVVAVAVVVGVWLGGSFGARALNVVVAPSLAVLVFAVGYVALTDRPKVERTVPEPGWKNDSRIMTLSIETNAVATITDRLTGVSPERIERAVSTDRSIEYAITLAQRGVHRVGPLTVTVSDPLGMVTKQYQYIDFDPIVVYPDIQQLTTTVLAPFTESHGRIERQEFERLREYEPGESLRNVHWKTSAKHDDLFVVEYTHSGATGVSVVAEAVSGEKNADVMASATASIVCFLLSKGVSVELTVPNGRLEHGHADRQRTLELLAATTPGRVRIDRIDTADVYVLGERGRAIVEVGTHRFPFEQLTGSPGDQPERTIRGVLS